MLMVLAMLGGLGCLSLRYINEMFHVAIKYSHLTTQLSCLYYIIGL